MAASTNGLLFANLSQSFLPNSGVSRTGNPFVPEYGTQYKVVAKVELLSELLFVNVAPFEITKNSVLTIDTTSPNFSIQVGKQQSKGIEFDITGEVLPG